MKIEGSSKPFVAPVTTPPQPRAPQNTAPSGEAVSLSALAGALQAGDRAPVNSTRIQEIKEAIAQGKFKINPEAIADRLLDTARDLVSARKNTA